MSTLKNLLKKTEKAKRTESHAEYKKKNIPQPKLLNEFRYAIHIHIRIAYQRLLGQWQEMYYIILDPSNEN